MHSDEVTFTAPALMWVKVTMFACLNEYCAFLFIFVNLQWISQTMYLTLILDCCTVFEFRQSNILVLTYNCFVTVS